MPSPTPSWTSEQVLALAPDASSARAGQGLATVSKWPSLGRSARAAWGECQGSGAKPYLTRVDLAEPAFKCSCPSRKFPCKHALGLMLLLAEGRLPEGEPPEWAAEWLAARDARRADREDADSKAPSTPDPAAKARRTAKREASVAAGLDLAERWVLDLLGEGLGAAQTKPGSFWEQTAARLVDTQCPGLAATVRRIGASCTTGDRWQERMLDELARLWLLTKAGRALDRLPAELAAEARSLIGYTVPREEVLQAGERVSDEWLVAGQAREDDGRLRVQRTWLWGLRHDRPALVLDYAAAGAPLDASFIPGSSFEAELAFYPGVGRLRAHIDTRADLTPAADWGERGDASLSAAFARAGDAAIENPWQGRVPMLLREQAIVRLPDDRWGLGGADGALPLDPRTDPWPLLAHSGGGPASFFAEWDGAFLRPLAASRDGRHLALQPEHAR